MEEIKLRQCNRCHAVYDKPAQAHKKNNIIVQVCPWCACAEFTRVQPRTEAQRKAAQQPLAPDVCKGCGANLLLTTAFEDGAPVCDACGTRR